MIPRKVGSHCSCLDTESFEVSLLDSVQLALCSGNKNDIETIFCELLAELKSDTISRSSNKGPCAFTAVSLEEVHPFPNKLSVKGRQKRDKAHYELY